MKLISLNLAGYHDWQDRIESIVSYVESESPDLLFLQEVRFDESYAQYNQAQEINNKLKSKFNYSSSSITEFYRSSEGAPYKEGLAILSRFPIENSETVALYQHADDKHTRIVQNIDIRVGGQEIMLSNVHFSNNRYSITQLDELIRILDSRGQARIIAGDFNVFDTNDIESISKEKYVVSTNFKSYVSFPSEGKTLDYVLLPKEFNYTDVKARKKLSDHAAIMCQFEM